MVRRLMSVDTKPPTKVAEGPVSRFLFVVHRGGSIFLHDKVAAPLSRDLGLMCTDLGTYLFKYPPSEKAPYVGMPWGRFYSKIYVPFHPFIRLPPRCKAACIIRDPRDVAVSTYYSLAYSHPLLPGEDPRARIARQRAMRQQGLKQWTIEEGLPVAEMELRAALSLSQRSSGVRLFKYEEMVTDWPVFLRGLFRWFGVGEELDEKYLELSGEFNPKGEDILSHKRQVRPGNWRRLFDSGLEQAAREIIGTSLGSAGYSWD